MVFRWSDTPQSNQNKKEEGKEDRFEPSKTRKNEQNMRMSLKISEDLDKVEEDTSISIQKVMINFEMIHEKIRFQMFGKLSIHKEMKTKGPQQKPMMTKNMQR